MGFGDSASYLLSELESKEIIPHNHKLLFDVENENQFLMDEMEVIKLKSESAVDITSEVSINFIILTKFKERNIQILANYYFHRLKKITNSVLSNRIIKNENLSKEEKNYAKRCLEAYDDYKKKFINLNFENEEPPIDIYVTIITKEDCGVIMVENEIVDLKKGKLYFIKRKSINHLLKQGRVELVKK